MRLATIVFAAIAGLATAQLNLPSCAQQCATEFTKGSTIAGCQLNNIRCICESGGFLADIACCLSSRCSAADQVTAASEAATFCRNVAGVTNLPTAVVCSTGSASPTASATQSSASVSSSRTTSAAASVSSVLSSVSSGLSSAASAATTSPTSTPNAAIHNVAGVGAGVLGAFAAVLL